MKRAIYIGIIITTFWLTSCTQAPEIKLDRYRTADQPELVAMHQQIWDIIEAPHFKPSYFGIYIEQPEERRVIFAHDPHKLFMPASNMKLFTTATALEILGPDYTYNTGLYLDGIIEKGIAKGDLYVKGSGDPTISGRHYDGDMLHVFKRWSCELKKQGVKKIEGRLIGDDNLFEEQELGYGWAWDDLSYYYAAKISGISFNDNCQDLYLIPADSVGQPAKILTKPSINYMQIQNELQTVPADSEKYIDFYRYPGTETVHLFGTIPVDSDTVIEWVTVDNPTLFFLNTFKKCLEDSGITLLNTKDIDDLEINKPDYKKMQLLAQHESVPMSEIVRTINKVSQNFYAETVQKTLGLATHRKASRKDGIKAEKEWFAEIGIPPDNIFIVDGSGLSRHNLVSPYQMGTLLRTMKYHRHNQIFFNSLPIGGVDGTLKNRLEGSNAQGHVHAKTGYVGRVRTLSGYVNAKDGTDYIFSIMVNHYPTPTSLVNKIQDQIVTLLYNFKSE